MLYASSLPRASFFIATSIRQVQEKASLLAYYGTTESRQEKQAEGTKQESGSRQQESGGKEGAEGSGQQ